MLKNQLNQPGRDRKLIRFNHEQLQQQLKQNLLQRDFFIITDISGLCD
jgi:hypothetical protein